MTIITKHRLRKQEPPASPLPLWAFFSTFRARRNSVELRVRTAGPDAARALRQWMRCGRLDKGVWIYQGQELPEVMQVLGYPRHAVEAARAFTLLVPAPKEQIGAVERDELHQRRTELFRVIRREADRTLHPEACEPGL